MKPGDAATIGGYSATLTTLGEHQGPNYSAQVAEFRLERDGELIALLHPEKRFYPVQGTPTTEAAIHTTWRADIYIALGDPDAASGGIGVRLYYNPFVAWIWFGALMLVAGGLLSLSDRRLRVGAPAKTRARPTQPALDAASGGSAE
jgi:cytochrome c-type biogenesis protein CcmF